MVWLKPTETPAPVDRVAELRSHIDRVLEEAAARSTGELQRVAAELSHLVATLGGRVSAEIAGHSAFANDVAERALLLAGRQAAWALESRAQLDTLADAEFRVFSQWGEDGIIEWLVQNIPNVPTRLVEFGVQTFREANTRFLVQNRNWRALVMDGDESYGAALRASAFYWMYDVSFVTAFITAENITRLIHDNGFGGPIGILSIDIDGNDYWVWDAIEGVNAAIVICECNPILGDVHPVSIPYDPGFTRFKGHHSGLYFGASIEALQVLGARKGYEFVGTNSHGINAFFVRRDLWHHIETKIKTRRAWPSRHRDSRNAEGQLNFTGGLSRFELIKHLPVVNVITGERSAVGNLGPAFSELWQKEL
jgi:hypothetical protein